MCIFACRLIVAFISYSKNTVCHRCRCNFHGLLFGFIKCYPISLKDRVWYRLSNITIISSCLYIFLLSSSLLSSYPVKISFPSFIENDSAMRLISNIIIARQLGLQLQSLSCFLVYVLLFLGGGRPPGGGGIRIGFEFTYVRKNK